MVSAVNSGSFDYSQVGMTTTQMSEAANQVKDQTLSQEDFLKLLTTQLQAQDPTNPADNSEIVSQMSQLSMVESLNSINSNMSGVIDTVNSSSTMSATNLIGTYVYTDDNYGVFDGGNTLAWSLDAGDEIYNNVKISIKDASTGEIVYTDTADALTGEVKFAWPGIYSPDGTDSSSGAGIENAEKSASKNEVNTASADGETSTDGTTEGDAANGTEEGGETAGTAGDSDDDTSDTPEYEKCAPGRYIIEVTGTNSSGQAVAIPNKALALVTSVTLGKTRDDTMLTLYGHGELSFSKANKVTL